LLFASHTRATWLNGRIAPKVTSSESVLLLNILLTLAGSQFPNCRLILVGFANSPLSIFLTKTSLPLLRNKLESTGFYHAGFPQQVQHFLRQIFEFFYSKKFSQYQWSNPHNLAAQKRAQEFLDAYAFKIFL